MSKSAKSKFGPPHIITPALQRMREEVRAAWRPPAKIGGKDNTDKKPWPNPEQEAVEAICAAMEVEAMWVGMDEFAGKPKLFAPSAIKNQPAYSASNLLVAISIAGQHQISGRAVTRAEGQKGLEAVAAANGYNPMRDEFRKLADNWDGKPGRVGEMIDQCFGGFSDIPRGLGIFYWWAGLSKMIARAWTPSPHGVKADEMLVLRGRQGTRKSTFLRELAGKPEYHTETDILREENINKRVEVGLGKMIVECADIDSTKDKKSFAELKPIQSMLNEETRLAWHFSPHRYPRTYLWTGTANEGRIVNDPTGGRRFWIMTPTLADDNNKTVINTEWLIENRDQLLGEIIGGYGLRELLEECTEGGAEWNNSYFDTALIVPEELRRWHDKNERDRAYARAGADEITEETLAASIPDYDPLVGATTGEIYMFVLENYSEMVTTDPRAAAKILADGKKVNRHHSVIADAMRQLGYEKRPTNKTKLAPHRKVGKLERWIKVRTQEEAELAAGPTDFFPPRFLTAAERADDEISAEIPF